ncbi:hypothetical protein M758_9G137100 [Ceratodon purpureus]|nr:hypothetical protein M758_9G137100 [Ceratodon purpureus]
MACYSTCDLAHRCQIMELVPDFDRIPLKQPLINAQNILVRINLEKSKLRTSLYKEQNPHCSLTDASAALALLLFPLLSLTSSTAQTRQLHHQQSSSHRTLNRFYLERRSENLIVGKTSQTVTWGVSKCTTKQ